ncbi:MAG: ABATE domain-containing protein [Actinomycetota bacterium]|nr:ABATE domain-containing protein [Actinomycetota bacterium]
MIDVQPPANDEEFRFRASRLSLDFCATVVGRHGHLNEQLNTVDDLARWIVLAGVAPFAQGAGQLNDLRAARALREAIYRLVRACMEGAHLPPEDVSLVNAAAAHPTPTPRLSPDGRTDWITTEPGQSALAAVARDAIELLTSPLAGRIRECASEDCSYVFVDTSRQARRRWCSIERCGNREHVRRHRSRPQKPQ